MNEFQSQEIVHNILQVVCEACCQTKKRESVFISVTSDKVNKDSMHRNSVHIEHESETVDASILNRLWNQRRE